MNNAPVWLTPSRWGLALRSALSAGAVVAVALVLGAAALLFVLDRTLLSALDDAATGRAADLTVGLRTDPPADLDSELFDTDQRIALVQVVDTVGAVVRSSQDDLGLPVTGVHPPVGGAPVRGLVSHETGGADLRTTVQGAHGVGGDYTVIVAASEESVEATLATVGGLVAAGAPVIALVAAGVTYKLVRRSLGSVERIRTQVAAISTTDLGERVPVPRPRDEIAALARTMNDMLGRIQAGHAAQRRFIADASHELRSPLATLTTALDVADARPEVLNRDLVRGTLRPETTRMQLLVDDLVLLARADELGLPLRVADVDLDDIVDTEVRRSRADTTVTVTAALTPVRIRGDAAQLSRAVRNLVDNAVRFAATTVSIEVSRSGHQARVTVDDDGPGIPESDRARVFERFVRLDSARSRAHGGSGLGLAIVAEIVSAHRGSVRIDTAEHGGTRVVVTLPVEEGCPESRS
ncbi:HAMP domain-containing histidine kinase [Rhodococcus pseudokoreensis]|uniref:histidine kinase n=1 Tax=Rhodococcus pseudokoreensis TaxID=2811421 RepID=A0A974ZV69_9NOCA|nr:HAMP domain-containing sensor histidine kinase [Rhodococcus pseudokoreensis]QSE91539.1 HAMP domain-containing histidine kinase [Rhodococcus pseudokoreensis]